MNYKKSLRDRTDTGLTAQAAESVEASAETAVSRMLTVCRNETHDLVAKELQSPLLQAIADAYFSGDLKAFWDSLCALDVDLQNASYDDGDVVNRERARDLLQQRQQGQFHHYVRDLESFINNGRRGYIHYLLVDGGYSRIIMTTSDDHGVTSDSGNKLFIRCSTRSSAVVQKHLREMGVTVD